MNILIGLAITYLVLSIVDGIYKHIEYRSEVATLQENSRIYRDTIAKLEKRIKYLDELYEETKNAFLLLIKEKNPIAGLMIRPEGNRIITAKEYAMFEKLEQESKTEQ